MPRDVHKKSLIFSIFDLFFHNLGLKFLAFVFALAMFTLVRTEQVKEYPRVAKIRIQTSDTMTVVGSAERLVDVTVRHPKALIPRQPTDRELEGEVDARSLKPGGRVRIVLSSDNFPNLDKGYALKFDKSYIDVEVDQLAHKLVPVKLVLDGAPKDGMTIKDLIVKPSQVEAFGAAKEILALERLLTTPINIRGIEKNFSTDAKIQVDENSSVRVKESVVSAQIIVGPARANRIFRSIPVEVKGVAKSEAKPEVVDIEVQGSREVLDGLLPREIQAWVDATELLAQGESRPVSVRLPSGVGLVRVTPDFVMVRLKK